MPDHKAGAPGLSGLPLQVWLPRGSWLPPRAPTDGRMDGQTAVPAAATPGHGQASHSFVLLLWLWVLFSSSPPFSLSLGAFRYGRCQRLAACSGEPVCRPALPGKTSG